MHSFSIDTQERKNIIVAIALLSIPLSWGINKLLQPLGLSNIWWINTPSVLGVIGLLYKLFDKWIWRICLLRTLGIIKTPDLNGEWEGYVATSFDEYADHHSVSVKIHQGWTRISIFLKSSRSESHSLTASILTCQPGGVRISYEYENEPKSFAESTMHAHRGTAILKLQDLNELEGEYYSGRDRNNFGSMYLKKMR
jgi:hypothetical protein